MLSYRHAFHAGNHADVLKHLVLVQCLKYLNRKDKPYWVIDTHAGAGAYRLDEGYSLKNNEHAGGVARLWGRRDLPAPLAEYLEVVRGFNRGPDLKRYPGSPTIAQILMRPDDRLRLYELHSSDAKLLAKQFESAGKQVTVEASDGFGGLKASLPPLPRRGLVLIDPAYEMKGDYDLVRDALADALKRFPDGTYVVWYPLLQKGASKRLPDALKALSPANYLNATLSVSTPTPDGYGMHGSGMFVVNPPYTLPEALKASLPVLVKLLGEDDGAGFKLDFAIP